MSATKKEDYRNSPDVLRQEAEAERERAAFVAASKDRLGERCPECGNLGSMEMFDGVLRCVDCDEVVARKASLGGLGRK